MKLAIVGTGYVGLVTGTCFADLGHDVICCDIDQKKIDLLNNGEIPIYEPGLEEMVASNIEDGRLHFTTDVGEAIRDSLMVFICVGTPPQEDGTADLTYVLGVAKRIGEEINGYKIVVDKSTVPVGTADKVRAAVLEAMQTRGVSHEFDVVSNPEFLKEGAAIEDFMVPDRVVIGCDNVRVKALMEEVYANFAKNGRPIIVMSTRAAEMTKYAANAMLATKISFMNEIAGICENVGADVDEVRNGIGSDRRIGYRFIFPGIGYGGSCFPKDVKALISTAREAGVEPKILPAVDEVNEHQKRTMTEKLRLYYRDAIEGKTFAVWGLAFKPETDDVREAPALVIVEWLLSQGARIRAYDPRAEHQARLLLGENPGIEYISHYYDALEGVDALILCTEWKFFRNVNAAKVKELMKAPVVFDGRNVYNPALMKTEGFDYFCIGREPVLAYSQGLTGKA
ncbi:MAG: nucleotide sugar dehydrogenase [Candidatus Hydrogenedens sp.]|nr:nucleotide sugar dehydrogenase [Candidatus Hydrogenedens sp.]